MLSDAQFEVLPEYAYKQYMITAALWGEDEELDDSPCAKLVILLANALLDNQRLETIVHGLQYDMGDEDGGQFFVPKSLNSLIIEACKKDGGDVDRHTA